MKIGTFFVTILWKNANGFVYYRYNNNKEQGDMVKEITNKTFRKRMKDEGLEHIHLYKECTEGYHYIASDNDDVYIKETAIYLPYFSDQNVAQWIKDIKCLMKI